MTDATHKDRSGWLIFFGIVQLLLGACCGLFLLFLLIGMALSGAIPGQPPSSPRMMSMSLAMYAAAGAVFVWLGVGSIGARRWARAMSLVVSSLWLACGVFMAALTPLMAKAIFAAMEQQPHLSHRSEQMLATVERIVITVALTMIVLFFVVLPGVLVLFYRGRNVRLTCEARNPSPAWTDRAPLPVLALCTMLALAGFSLAMMGVGLGAFPVFGWVASGWAAAAIGLAVGGGLAIAGRLCFLLRRSGWWAALALFGASIASNVATFSQMDVVEFYRRADFPAEQLVVLERARMFGETGMTWMTLVAALPFLGYMLWVERYFRAGRAAPPVAGG